ncbi:Cell division protein FtsN [Candidatus Burkholderia crenata]|nr:Cell division protein FtsN [Candidatus Burkholderia crenata]
MAKPRSTSKQSKQTGDTFLGTVLGLIVGLAIAVIVALYITRAPTPFVAKVAPAPPVDAGSAPATTGQPYDPNRPLQGKTLGQANNQTQSSGMQDEPEILEVPPVANAPGGSSSATPAKKPAEAQVSSTAKITPPAPGNVNTGYFLQVGAYKTQADAEQQRARLGFQGFESKVTQRDAGSMTYYRVRIGPFTKFEDMNNVRQRLSDAGVDTAVIRFSKQ